MGYWVPVQRDGHGVRARDDVAGGDDVVRVDREACADVGRPVAADRAYACDGPFRGGVLRLERGVARRRRATPGRGLWGGL